MESGRKKNNCYLVFGGKNKVFRFFKNDKYLTRLAFAQEAHASLKEPQKDSLTKSFTMHNKAEFLSRLTYNAYEFDKWEMRFHLRKSVVTSAKKIIKVNGTFIA